MQQFQASSEKGTQHRIRVFIAEDHPAVKQGLSLIIDTEPDMMVVGGTGNGREVIDGVLASDADVVLMDIDLPELSGIDATRRLSELAPDASVLIFTGHENEGLLIDAIEAGATGYALKGIPVADLLRAIRTVHAGEICISPRMTTKLVGEYLKQLHSGSEEDDIQRLSRREREVLPLLAGGKSHDDIARALQVSPYTIQTYRQRIMKKLDLHSGTDLLRYAFRKGIVNLNE